MATKNYNLTHLLRISKSVLFKEDSPISSNRFKSALNPCDDENYQTIASFIKNYQILKPCRGI